jgi:hypothetical protein
MAGFAAWIDMQLYGHQNRGLISDRPRAVALFTVCLCAALVLTKRKLARSLLDAGAIHALNPPAAREHDDPLRCRVFVPVTNPPDWLNRKDNGSEACVLFVVPLRVRRADPFEIKIGEMTLLLMANAIRIYPQMPVGDRRHPSRIAHGCAFEIA